MMINVNYYIMNVHILNIISLLCSKRLLKIRYDFTLKFLAINYHSRRVNE